MTNAIRKFLLSPICLVSAVCFTLMIIFSITTAGNFVSDIMDELIEDIGDIDEVMYYLEIPGKIASATTFLSQIPNIIIAIGIWLTVYSAYDKNTDNISAAGISMIKVMSIISYVFSIISFIGFIILDIVLIVRIVNYYNELRDFYDLWGISGYASGTTLILPIVLLVIITACLGFRCFFRRKVIHTANSFKCAIIDNSILYPSLLVQVMCFISAIGSAFTAILGSASMWFSVAAYIGFGILISQFREILRRFSSQNAMMYK